LHPYGDLRAAPVDINGIATSTMSIKILGGPDLHHMLLGTFSFYRSDFFAKFREQIIIEWHKGDSYDTRTWHIHDVTRLDLTGPLYEDFLRRVKEDMEFIANRIKAIVDEYERTSTPVCQREIHTINGPNGIIQIRTKSAGLGKSMGGSSTARAGLIDPGSGIVVSKKGHGFFLTGPGWKEMQRIYRGAELANRTN
jgi:hypothetical protein